MYSVQCTLYSVQCTVYSVQCTVYSVHCTVYSVQCTVYSVQCTVYSVSLTEDEHNVLETCSRQEEINKIINLRNTFCWLILHKCVACMGEESGVYRVLVG